MATTTKPTVNRESLKPSRSQARFAFTVLLIINILNYADRYVLSAVLPKIKADLALSDTQLGLLSSAFLLVYALTTLPLGVWADRSIRKNIVAICVGVWSIATTLAGFTGNFIQLISTRTVLGIGEAGYAPATLSLLGDYFPKERRGRVLSFYSIGNLIGTAFGLVMGGLVADAFGWHWAFFIVGIPGLIAAFLIWRATEPTRGIYESEDGDDASATHGGLGRDFWGAVRHLFRIPTYWVLLGAFVFSFFTIGGASAWIPSYFKDAFSLTVGQSSAISGGVLAGGSLIGTLAGGWVSDYLQRRRPEGRMIVVTFAFLVGAPLTLLALSLHTLLPFITVFFVAIICLSLSLGPLNAIVQDVIIPEVRATAFGLALLLAHLLGDASSPLIIGILSDKFHALGYAHSLGVALLATAPFCLALAGIVCLIGLRTVARDMKSMQEHLHGKHEPAH
ncbi:MAG: MFS transporter [Ktedonobacteraceae bacterium]